MLLRLPFDHYGKDVAGWSATRLASMHALLALPWAVKPIYGALSDNVPLFGSRRRSYLVVANALSATLGQGDLLILTPPVTEPLGSARSLRGVIRR